MRVLVFSPDTPYPPNRGGRADIWRRIEAFVALGHSVMLVHLTDPTNADSSNEANLSVIESVVDIRESFPIRRNLYLTVKQLARALWVPWHVATRVPDFKRRIQIIKSIRSFKPDVLWLDGPWFGVLAKDVAADLNIPLLYRSHNVEHRYIRGQAKVAVRIRDRIAWSLACIGLEKYEYDLLNLATSIFDISVEDMKYWQSRGIDKIKWLPPLPHVVTEGQGKEAIYSDVLFTGNLSTPNNVRGVEWLIVEVLPLVLKELPNLHFTVVGSNPTEFVLDLLSSAENVDISFNVPDTTPYLAGAKVLVNPVATGSGVQVKMLDMLMTDAPIVTTSQGVFGLPSDFKNLVNVADGADLFARFICDEFRVSSVDLSVRASARKLFSIAALDSALGNTNCF